MDERKKALIDIWTIETTLVLYRQLMKRFGPHREWYRTSFPYDKRFDYDDFCEKFAAAHGAKSADAVKMQVGWAVGRQPMIKNRHNMRNIFRNKLCAWDVDFIDGRLLPAWSMNWYKNVSDNLKELTKRMMKRYIYGEMVSINDAVDAADDEKDFTI